MRMYIVVGQRRRRGEVRTPFRRHHHVKVTPEPKRVFLERFVTENLVKVKCRVIPGLCQETKYHSHMDTERALDIHVTRTVLAPHLFETRRVREPLDLFLKSSQANKSATIHQLNRYVSKYVTNTLISFLETSI